MSPQPALYAILDAVVTNLLATSGYTSPTGASGIVVFDGPIGGTNDNPAKYVCVGWREGGDEAGTLTTAPWAFSGRADRYEEGTFSVTAVAASGDQDLSALRASMRSITKDLTAAVYGLSDSTFEGGFWAQISDHTLRQAQSAAGATVYAEFTFTYRVGQAA